MKRMLAWVISLLLAFTYWSISPTPAMAGEIPFNQAFDNIKKNADALGSLIPDPLSMEKSERERRGIVKTRDRELSSSSGYFEGNMGSLYEYHRAFFERQRTNRIVNLIDEQSPGQFGQDFMLELPKLLVFGVYPYHSVSLIQQDLEYYYPGWQDFPEDSLVFTLINHGDNAVMWEQQQTPSRTSYVNRFWVLEDFNPNALTVLQGQGLDWTTRTDLPKKPNIGPIIYDGQNVSSILPPYGWLVISEDQNRPIKRYYSVMFETANKIDPGQAFDFAAAFVKAIKGESVAPKPQPPVAGAIPGQKATETEVFKFTIPDGTFTDPDGDDNQLEFKATLDDGSPMPSWLTFNPKTHTFSGTPGHQDGGTLKIKVSASDAQGTASTTFDLTVKTLKASVFSLNLDARTNNSKNPVVQSLKAGKYKVHILSKQEGAQFEAYFIHSKLRGCDGDGKNCKKGWETRYYFKSPYHKVVDNSCSKPFTTSKKHNTKTCRYSTPELAADNAPKDVEFTLKKDADVKFYIWDSQGLDNNQGGLSLKISQQL